MTNVLAIRTDGYSKNLDKTRIDNAKMMSTGPWNVNPKRLIDNQCWIVLYRDNYPDVIATIRKPWWVEPINNRYLIQLHFNYATTVRDDLRYDCEPWNGKRNPMYYTTFEKIFPNDMHEDYLEMNPAPEWSDIELFGEVRPTTPVWHAATQTYQVHI